MKRVMCNKCGQPAYQVGIGDHVCKAGPLYKEHKESLFFKLFPPISRGWTRIDTFFMGLMLGLGVWDACVGLWLYAGMCAVTAGLLSLAHFIR